MLHLILGGTFDPIHYGHLRPALAAAEHIGAAQLSLLPSARPPHRQGLGASAEQRLQMAQLAAASITSLPCVADDWELRASRPSYTVQTLQELAARWPQQQLVFALGADAFAQLDTWYHWQQLLDHAHLLVLNRPQHDLSWRPAVQQFYQQHQCTAVAQLQQQQCGLIYLANCPPQPFSASAIRAAIRHGQPWRHAVPAKVAEYIDQHQLYRDKLADRSIKE